MRDDQALAMHLAGTVRLPSPAPATGALTVQLPEKAESDPNHIYLKITHRVHERLKIIRYVRLADVRSVQGIWPEKPKPSGGARSTAAVSPAEPPKVSHKHSKEIRAHVHDLITAAKGVGEPLVCPSAAAIFVPETAPVLMEVEVGMTAAESADYYPPLPVPPKGPTCESGVGGSMTGFAPCSKYFEQLHFCEKKP
jgi:hypothetical protein